MNTNVIPWLPLKKKKNYCPMLPHGPAQFVKWMNENEFRHVLCQNSNYQEKKIKRRYNNKVRIMRKFNKEIKVLKKITHLRARVFGDVKKYIFYIFKIYFIYFTILFYNSPNISISIFTYNSLK